MTVTRTRLYISGRVQGVNFRYFTRQEALRLGLAGWVRNLPDGRVEVVAEGEEEQVERLIGWCRGGPPLAVVKGLDIRREPPIGDSKTFTIRL